MSHGSTAGFLYSNESGEVPVPEIGVVEGTTWVALNAPLKSLPAKAMTYIHSVQHHPGNAALEDNGLFQEMEWSTHPDWWRHDHDYRAWIPILPCIRSSDPWYLQKHQDAVILRVNDGKYYVEEAWRKIVVEDLTAAADGVRDIVSRPPFTSFHPRPVAFRMDALKEPRKTEKEARAVLSAARRNMLEHLAFFSWRTSTCVNWNRDLTNSTITLVEGYDLAQYGKRGVLIYLARDWREISIPTLLHHNIPILFPWTPKEEADPRFACLAPSILSAYKDRCVAAGGQNQATLSAEVAQSKSFKSLFGYSIFMDDPPHVYVKPAGAPEVIPRSAGVRIIDFPGWSSRDVPTKKLKKKYFSTLHFGMFQGVAVFWRYRPLNARTSSLTGMSDDEEGSDHEGGTVDDVEVLLAVREQYRGNCAPKPGQVFDEENGFQKVRPYTGTDLLSRFEKDLERRLMDPPMIDYRLPSEVVVEVARMIREDPLETAMEVDESPVGGEGEEVELESPPVVVIPISACSPSAATNTKSGPNLQAPAGVVKNSLLDRMSSPGEEPKVHDAGSSGSSEAKAGKGTLMTRLGITPPTAPRAERERQANRSKSWASSDKRRGRSASPPSRRSSPPRRQLPPRPRTPEGGYRHPNEEQAERLNAWITGSAKLAHDFSFISFEDERWNSRFLDHAYLVIDNPIARVRLRYLASATNAKSPVDVLEHALMRGLPFRLAISQADISQFRLRNLSSAERALTGAYFPIGSGEPALAYGKGGPEFSMEYQRRFLDMLRRPHMRRLAGMGGVFTWLAWRTELGLVREFMQGPSIQVTQFMRGWTDGHTDNPLFIASDELSHRDQETLLGHVYDNTPERVERWVWPSDDLLTDLCDHYSGELNPEVDSFLSSIYAEIKDGQAQARSRSQWAAFFRRGNRGALAPKSKKMSKGELLEEEAKMRRIFADDWSVVKVRRMTLPGIVRST
ncbi:hypothetical protein C8R47DRAFT_1265822 [Mycena vitilis]|nr:hypothetical protein C8R47DRAFT_1265822 [Mycena vitilis]